MKLFKLVAGLMLGCATTAFGGDFIDTRVTFALSNDNVFVKPGETTPNSPGTGFGAARQNTQFFDNFNTRYTGYETLSNLTLYKKSPSFFEGFDAEAALNVLVLTQPSGAISFVDNSTYIKLNYRPAGWGPKEDISLTGFPVSSDRFRLGYNWKVSWGGDTMFTYNQGSGTSLTGRPSAIPGGKIQVTRDHWYAFVGMKTGLLFNKIIGAQERSYGALLGGGFDLYQQGNRRLRLEANGAYFGRGIIPSLADQQINAPITGAGGSARLSFSQGDEIQSSIDIRLYKNDPDVLTRFFRPENYPGGLSMQLEIETAYLTQTLVDPDRFATTKLQPAQSVAVQARFKYDFWRFFGLGLYRTLSFIQFDVPSLIPYTDFASGTQLTPEVWFAVGVDRFVPRFHLTVGLVGGVQVAASATAKRFDLGGNNPPPGLEGPRTVVVPELNMSQVLPSGTAVQPIFSIKGTFKLDISEYFAAIGELYYSYDYNRVTFRDSTASVSVPVFERPHRLGFNLVVQARF